MRRSFGFALALIFAFFSLTELMAQKVEISNYGSTSESRILASDDGTDYKITITKPEGYDPDSPYSVLYYLDAWWLSELIRGNHAIASLSNNIEAIILVGISADGDETDWHRQRNMDYTPSPYSKKIMGIQMSGGFGKLDSSSTGGANDFIKFLESKVFPVVEKEHSKIVDRGLMGHSFGGLFGAYVLQSRPDIFQNLFLISPAVWWNRSEILEDELFEEARNEHPKIYVAVGRDEISMLTKPVTRLNSLLSFTHDDSNNYKYQIFDETNHNSILPQAIYQGLVFMYGKNRKS